MTKKQIKQIEEKYGLVYYGKGLYYDAGTYYLSHGEIGCCDYRLRNGQWQRKCYYTYTTLGVSHLTKWHDVNIETREYMWE